MGLWLWLSLWLSGESIAFFLKKSYYFVSYQRADGLVNLGPTWLVDVKKRKTLPKNAMARAAMNPQQINPKGYFERERQIIGSIANHSFPSGVKLGGIMLIHFATLESQIEDDRIVDDVLRIDDHKRRSVEAFQSLNYQVVAAGDSYNDLSMIRAADAGALFHAPPNVIGENPDLPAFDSYDDLRAWIDDTDSVPGA